MNYNQFQGVLIGLLLACLMFFSYKLGEEQSLKNFQQRAIDAGSGGWSIDSKSGDIYFEFY
jgi:hypothetical protein